MAHGKILSVMDADFSHPPSLLPVMFQAINNTGKEYWQLRAAMSLGAGPEIGRYSEKWSQKSQKP